MYAATYCRLTEEMINVSLDTESKKPKAACFEREYSWRVRRILCLREETLWTGISGVAAKMLC